MVTRVFFMLLLQVIFAYGERFANESTDFRDYPSGGILKHPLSDGFISRNNGLRPGSIWGCDKYSAAFYVVTKDAIAIAKRVAAEYLEQERVARSNFTLTPAAGQQERKLTIIRQGVQFYTDLTLILKVLWHDSMNAISMLGQELSTELEWHVSQMQQIKT